VVEPVGDVGSTWQLPTFEASTGLTSLLKLGSVPSAGILGTPDLSCPPVTFEASTGLASLFKLGSVPSAGILGTPDLSCPPVTFEASTGLASLLKFSSVPSAGILGTPNLSCPPLTFDPSSGVAALLKISATSPRTFDRGVSDVAPKRIEVEVNCDSRCACCEGPILVKIERRETISPTRITIDLGLDVFPFCSSCRELGVDQALEAALTELVDDKPTLQLIDGRGRGDGRPRGQLRIVHRS